MDIEIRILSLRDKHFNILVHQNIILADIFLFVLTPFLRKMEFVVPAVL